MSACPRCWRDKAPCKLARCLGRDAAPDGHNVPPRHAFGGIGEPIRELRVIREDKQTR